MIDTLYEDLAWLPAAPPDFRERCRLVAQNDDPGRELRALASYALSTPQLNRLASAFERVTSPSDWLPQLAPFRLGLLGNGTLDAIAPAIVASSLRHGFAMECVTVPFGTFAQQAYDPASLIHRARCDAVLLALDARALPLHGPAMDREEARTVVDGAVAVLDGLRSALHAGSGTTCIVQTLAAFPETLFGNADRRTSTTSRYLVDAFNERLIAGLTGSPDVLLDCAALAETVGLGRWHSPAQWNLAKLPFADAYVPVYADQVARLVGAIKGKSRRCLVLDLDNTVWGGVVGDVGMENIAIAEGDAVGEAFRSVQRFALELRERGVVLAVSSKNDDAVARRVFREHPDMLLRENHIAVFQANWKDKASNIKAISEELSLGLDAFVFLDDNPAERGIVRQMLPDVAVPELPADPAYYARTLAAAGYFESTVFSPEDRQRADYYERNAKRVALQKELGGLDEYLASLDMEITFSPFDAYGRDRIAQLINKSNQFNLTTKRYTPAEIAQLERDSDVLALQIRLSDVFGDNGMISVVICRRADRAVWTIDTWLMSCRVLGRGVERMVLRELIARARACGIARLTGYFIPTGRNELVRDHYASLGFRPDGEAWCYDVTESEPEPTMRVRYG
jgi:FkbH-like protein